MNEQQRKFELYLDGQITECRQHSKLLAADERVEEGNFEKVRANVYEIFKTILSAAEKVCGKDDGARKRFFLQKTDEIPANWTTSYEEAKKQGVKFGLWIEPEKQGDVEKMHIESIKLDTVREIKEMCMQIWEETT